MDNNLRTLAIINAFLLIFMLTSVTPEEAMHNINDWIGLLF